MAPADAVLGWLDDNSGVGMVDTFFISGEGEKGEEKSKYRVRVYYLVHHPFMPHHNQQYRSGTMVPTCPVMANEIDPGQQEVDGG